MKQSPTVIVLTTQTQPSHRVHVYYMSEMFNLFHYVSLIVRNFTETLKPRIFNIIQIWSQRSQLHTIEASINFRSTEGDLSSDVNNTPAINAQSV